MRVRVRRSGCVTIARQCIHEAVRALRPRTGVLHDDEASLSSASSAGEQKARPVRSQCDSQQRPSSFRSGHDTRESLMYAMQVRTTEELESKVGARCAEMRVRVSAQGSAVPSCALRSGPTCLGEPDPSETACPPAAGPLRPAYSRRIIPRAASSPPTADRVLALRRCLPRTGSRDLKPSLREQRPLDAVPGVPNRTSG